MCENVNFRALSGIFSLIGLCSFLSNAVQAQEYEIRDRETKVLRAANGKFFARPTLAEAPDGTWVMVYTESSGHASMHDKLHIRFSRDNGKNWSQEDTTLNGSSVKGFPADPPPEGGPHGHYQCCEGYVYPAPNGDLLLITWQKYRNTDLRGSWQCRSSDGGNTWSAWHQIDFIGKENDDEIFVWGGQIVHDGVMYTSAGEWRGKGKPRIHVFLASTDNGHTWKCRSSVNHPPDIESVEKGFEYIGNDTIVFIGSHGGVRKHVLHGFSYDMGKTWESWKDIINKTLVWDRPRLFTLAHLKGEQNWWKDNLLIGCGNNTPRPGIAFPRRNCIWYSVDRGKTWSTPLPVDDFYQDGGYGDLLYDNIRNKIVFISYRSRLKPTANKKYNIRKGEAEIVQYTFTFAPKR